jgi:hypothetical protein
MLLLAALAIALGGIIAIEARPHTFREPVSMTADSLTTGPASPPAGDVREVQKWGDIILARPLFDPSRRLPATAGSSAGAPGLPRLAGIVIMPHQREAIFAVPGKTQPIVVMAGSRLNGVLIKAIDANGIVVVDAAGARMIRPSFAPRAAGEATPPADTSSPSFMIDLPPVPPPPSTSPFASIRGLSGRPLGLAAQPDNAPPNGGLINTAPSFPSIADPGVSP